jgi:hypothetical protein
MPALSKSRFMAGIQCIKRLWLTIHEPHAAELVPDEQQLWLFEHGHKVGEAARTALGPGPVIPASPTNKALQAARTQQAVATGEPRIFEAAFQHDDVFVAVDALDFVNHGWTVVEVKSSTKLKPEHVVDVAIQVHVLRGCGLEVGMAEVMHLNPDHRHPDTNPLFRRVPVRDEVAALLPMVPEQLNEMQKALKGPEPRVSTGAQCTRPYNCPFLRRCNSPVPRNHVSELYAIRRNRVDKLIEQGFDNIAQLPATTKLSKVQQRQRRAVIENKTVVEPGLGRVLDALEGPLGFLDFETVGVPLPIWEGTRPWEQVPVQFAAWVEREDGAVVTHHPFLASGRDPQTGPAPTFLSDLTRMGGMSPV